MDPPAPSTGPDDASARDQSAPSWRETLVRKGRRLLTVAVIIGATHLGGCLLVLLVYNAVFPPTTGVQVQHRVEAFFAEVPPQHTYEAVPLSQLDPDLPLAVVAGEDSRFFRHWGIDWTEVENAIAAYRDGGGLRGASSISQQLVKNLFLTTHRTLLRKALEVPLTYGAELLLSKRRILELYVNVIEWGPGVYGAEAAAQHHYGTSAQQLTRAQAAALAACIPNPRRCRPQTVGRYQQIILQRMNQIGRLPISQAFSSGSAAGTTSYSPRPRPHAPMPSGHYAHSEHLNRQTLSRLNPDRLFP